MILVTGANGRTGRAVLELLHSRGVPVRAMVRDVAKATELLATEMVVADFSKPQTLPSVVKDIDRVYLTSAPDPEQVAMHRNFIRAAAQAGVRYIVRQSVRGADENSPIKIARWHAASQRELETSGVRWTHLQPVFNMQNFLRFASTIRSEGTFFAPMREGAISMVDARDVASVAVEALTAAGHENQTYLVTGPEPLAFADAAQQLSNVLERPIRYVDVSPEQARTGMLAAGMPEWYVQDMLGFYAFYSTGAGAYVSDVVPRIVGRPGRRFRQFVEDHRAIFDVNAQPVGQS
jgi:uncharacterized protein YbjT (DUF2867 family)